MTGDQLVREAAQIAVDLHNDISAERALRYATDLDNLALIAEAAAPDAPESLSLREQAVAAADALREVRGGAA